MTLPAAFLGRPIAHRGLHDRASGVIENSRSAFEAAARAGYGIELDVQMSADGVPMVFHDHELDRLTAASGHLRDRTAEALEQIPLAGTADRIELLETILALIGNRAPVLVEIKDQAGPGATDRLAQATGRVLAAAAGPGGTQAAVMSFDPACIRALDWLPPRIPRGLTTGPLEAYPGRLSPAERAKLAGIEAFGGGMSFVSQHHLHLDTPRIAELAAAGAAILCWTIRSPEQEAAARLHAGNVTFEGYAA